MAVELGLTTRKMRVPRVHSGRTPGSKLRPPSPSSVQLQVLERDCALGQHSYQAMWGSGFTENQGDPGGPSESPMVRTPGLPTGGPGLRALRQVSSAQPTTQRNHLEPQGQAQTPLPEVFRVPGWLGPDCRGRDHRGPLRSRAAHVSGCAGELTTQRDLLEGSPGAGWGVTRVLETECCVPCIHVLKPGPRDDALGGGDFGR